MPALVYWAVCPLAHCEAFLQYLRHSIYLRLDPAPICQFLIRIKINCFLHFHVLVLETAQLSNFCVQCGLYVLLIVFMD